MDAGGALAALLPLGALALLVPLGILAFGTLFPATTIVTPAGRSESLMIMMIMMMMMTMMTAGRNVSPPT